MSLERPSVTQNVRGDGERHLVSNVDRTTRTTRVYEGRGSKSRVQVRQGHTLSVRARRPPLRKSRVVPSAGRKTRGCLSDGRSSRALWDETESLHRLGP